MSAVTLNQRDENVLSLSNAVFCLDCESISNSRSDECSVCKSRSVVSLARMLGGSLLAHKVQQLQGGESVLFEVTITVELQQIHAGELSATLEQLTSVIGPKLARGRASFHINVNPAARNAQQSFYFPERNAA